VSNNGAAGIVRLSARRFFNSLLGAHLKSTEVPSQQPSCPVVELSQ